MIRRLLSACLLAGFVAGLVVSLAQAGARPASARVQARMLDRDVVPVRHERQPEALGHGDAPMPAGMPPSDPCAPRHQSSESTRNSMAHSDDRDASSITRETTASRKHERTPLMV